MKTGLKHSKSVTEKTTKGLRKEGEAKEFPPQTYSTSVSSKRQLHKTLSKVRQNSAMAIRGLAENGDKEQGFRAKVASLKDGKYMNSITRQLPKIDQEQQLSPFFFP